MYELFKGKYWRYLLLSEQRMNTCDKKERKREPHKGHCRLKIHYEMPAQQQLHIQFRRELHTCEKDKHEATALCVISHIERENE